MSVVGTNIKNFRMYRKKSQADLAAALGKSKNVISNWEREDNSPDLDTLEKICNILQVTPNQIFGWDVMPEYESFQKEKKRKEERASMLREKIKELEVEIMEMEKEILEINSYEE